MVSPSVGAVALVSFPFSDLSATKLRPAFVLSGGERDDWLRCQITSNPYADSDAIEITDADFDCGSLQAISYARPGKLFTANGSLMVRSVGTLSVECHQRIVEAVITALTESFEIRQKARMGEEG